MWLDDSPWRMAMQRNVWETFTPPWCPWISSMKTVGGQWFHRDETASDEAGQKLKIFEVEHGKLSVKPLNFAAKKTVVLKGQFRRHHPHGCSTRRQGAYVEILCEPFASRHFLPLRCWFACLLMFGKHDYIDFLKYQLQGDRCGGCGLGTICRDLKRIWPALTLTARDWMTDNTRYSLRLLWQAVRGHKRHWSWPSRSDMSRGNDVATTSSITFSDRIDLGVNRSGHVEEVESRRLWECSRVALAFAPPGYFIGISFLSWILGRVVSSIWHLFRKPLCMSCVSALQLKHKRQIIRSIKRQLSITCRSVTFQGLKRR